MIFRFTKSPPLVDLARISWRRFQEERCLQIASSLTFTALLAIVPIITVALTLISAFPVFRELMLNIQQFLLLNMLPESAEAIAAYTEQFADNAKKLTAVGLVFLFVTAMIMLNTIDRAFNQIWRVPRRRSTVQRAFIYWALLTVGPILIGASLSITSWLVSQARYCSSSPRYCSPVSRLRSSISPCRTGACSCAIPCPAGFSQRLLSRG